MKIQINFDKKNVQIGFKNQFEIENTTNNNLVKILPAKGPKGDPGEAPDMSNYYTKSEINNRTPAIIVLTEYDYNNLSTYADNTEYHIIED